MRQKNTGLVVMNTITLMIMLFANYASNAGIFSLLYANGILITTLPIAAVAGAVILLTASVFHVYKNRLYIIGSKIKRGEW